MSQLTCYCNGKFGPLETTGLPVSDLIIQRGYGIFDFLRVDGQRPLFLEDHLDRFYNSAKIMLLVIKETKEEVVAIVHQLIQKNQLDYSGIRLIISGGDSEDGYKINQPRLIILQQPLPVPPRIFPLQGIKLVTHGFQRQLATVKTTDYLMAIYLQPWMKAQGGDDILYFSDDLVRECPRSNFFMVKNGVLVTPVNNMLLGITRKNIISLAADKNFKIEQRDITVAELNTAEEAFISSSTKRVTPVKQIDNYVLPAIHNSSLTYKIFEWLKEKEINL
jgi:D-alanine transaminase/branched-chain amino acid aminotransferase